MATPRPFDSYPTEYTQLFIEAASSKITILCSDSQEASRFRNRLYAFRRALLTDPNKAPAAALVAETVQLAIDGNKLIASPLEPLASNLQKALPDGKSSSSLSRRDRQHDTDNGKVVS